MRRCDGLILSVLAATETIIHFYIVHFHELRAKPSVPLRHPRTRACCGVQTEIASDIAEGFNQGA